MSRTLTELHHNSEGNLINHYAIFTYEDAEVCWSISYTYELSE